MTSPRSRATTLRYCFILVALLLLTGVANAGRKRVVVLDFEGDKAEKFHADVVKAIKKSHTVVSSDKWNGTAEELSATTLNGKNIKKVAKKLKVDGVVSGTVEKRRDEYILRLKLRSGATGEVIGSQINIKSESAKLDGTATKDLKEELIEVIAGLDSNRGGGEEEEEEEEKPKKGAKKPPVEEEEEEEKPKKGGFVKKGGGDEEEKPKKGAKKPPVEEEEEEKPKTAKKPPAEEEKPKKGAKKPPVEEEEKPKTAKKPPVEEEEEKPKTAKKPPAEEEEEEAKPKKGSKKVAKGGDDELEEGIEDRGEPSVAGNIYAPGERAVDAVLGLSFTARRMSFAAGADAVQRPAGYTQNVPVPGFYFDATLYPLAIGHKRKDLLRGIGVTAMFDRVISLSSKNPRTNEKLKSAEQRFAVGATFRYPLGSGDAAPVVGGQLRYGKQSFTIDGMALIPNVSYSLIDFTAFFQYPLNPKMLLSFNAGALLPTDAGDITKLNQYGRATITGFEGSAALDYTLTKNIFARGELRFETLGYSFLGEGEKSMGIGGARDTYFGGALTAGYLY